MTQGRMGSGKYMRTGSSFSKQTTRPTGRCESGAGYAVGWRTTVSAASIAYSASSVAAVVAVIPTAVSACVAAPARAPGGASVGMTTTANTPATTTASATVGVPAVVVAAGSDRASFLVVLIFRGGPVSFCRRRQV